MSKLSCYFETIEGVFNFGKYHGLTLADVLDIDPSYVIWCVQHCDGVHILIADNAISQIEKAFPEFVIDNSFKNLCHNRFIYYENDSSNT